MIKAYFNPVVEGQPNPGSRWCESENSTAIISNLYDFLKAANRGYAIQKTQAYQAFDGQYAAVENQFHLTRSNDQRVVSPHTVTNSYQPLSLMELADDLQGFCDAGWATPDAVYEARNGSLEVLTLRLDAGGEIQGEKWEHYIWVENPHGSGGKTKGKITSYRAMCANGFNRLLSQVAEFSISHRVANGDTEEQQRIMNERKTLAIQTWQNVQDHIKRMSEKINIYSNINLSKNDMLKLTNSLLEIKSDEISTRTENKRDAIIAAFDMPTYGTNGKTLYDWANAVTFVNSSPFAEINKKSKVSFIDRNVRNIDRNGSGYKFEERAAELIEEFAGV